MTVRTTSKNQEIKLETKKNNWNSKEALEAKGQSGPGKDRLKRTKTGIMLL